MVPVTAPTAPTPTTANGGDVADLVHGSAEAELWERWKNGKSGTPLHLIPLKGVPPIKLNPPPR